jgi:glycogen debranching enzyme
MSPHQPYLNELHTAVLAPNFLLCDPDGQIRAGSAGGLYLADRRALSRAEVAVRGAGVAAIGTEFVDSANVDTTSVLRGLGDDGDDPTVLLEQRWELHADGARLGLRVVSHAHAPVRTTLTLTLSADLADISAVKSGMAVPVLAAETTPDGLRWPSAHHGSVHVRAAPIPASIEHSDATGAALLWNVSLLPGDTAAFEIHCSITDDPIPLVALPVRAGSVIGPVVLNAEDRRLSSLLARSLADLRGLELTDQSVPQDHFLAAGAPWYLTLFGRDSLIAARMLLPVGTDLAAGTLRTLARRQGRSVDPETAEEPGKIAHELRRAATDHGEANRADHHLVLPPLYYGTVDATALWVMLLHDAWRWGMPSAEVRELLPALERALAWMRDYGMGEHGFLSYADASGHGLANQGWKDSVDAVQFSDGRLATAPVALCEVQAYAHAAARNGADLLEAFERPGADGWRDWAAALAARFRARFWVTDADGRYPAIALDRDGQPVDTLTSNIGHLLGTGLLDADESALVVRRLSGTELSSGFGLRTLSDSAVGFNPLSYHCGSVWTHDTAVAISGLAAAYRQGVSGAAVVARTLIDGLLRAARDFDYRMPELYSGRSAAPGRRALPYPASCRPQAWSAASAVAVLAAVLGLEADAPGGRLVIRPLDGIGTLDVQGLRLADHGFAVTTGAGREISVHGLPASVRIG